ncbi:hypothetical protein CDL15_Pgr012912 [Punica granatum]|uniref:Uncharacterized protein n=1 Tax=Punica granatum TaxID=22663 RepID=A0A218XG27_PUNGR|nr:hypothetical protein CDL15_Pgr012912 [Punica granatum]
MGLFSKLLPGCFAGNKSSSKRVGPRKEEVDEGNLSRNKKGAKQDEKCSKSSSPMKRKSSPPIPVAYFPVGSRLSLL